MFGIAGTVELGTICPGTGTWNRLQDGKADGGENSEGTHLLERFNQDYLSRAYDRVM